jgi:hypothetical protein
MSAASADPSDTIGSLGSGSHLKVVEPGTGSHGSEPVPNRQNQLRDGIETTLAMLTNHAAFL